MCAAVSLSMKCSCLLLSKAIVKQLDYQKPAQQHYKCLIQGKMLLFQEFGGQLYLVMNITCLMQGGSISQSCLTHEHKSRWIHQYLTACSPLQSVTTHILGMSSSLSPVVKAR